MDVTDQSFEALVIKSRLPVVVSFWANDCAPCRMLAKVVDEFYREYHDKVKVFRLDVDANPNITKRFAIFSIPSLLFFCHGRLVDQIIGTCTKSKLVTVVDEVLKKT